MPTITRWKKVNNKMSYTKLCTVRKVSELAAGIFEIEMDAGEIADTAVPGQFVHVKCGHSRLLRRPISIAGAENGVLRIIFDTVGEGTQWLSHREAGDALDVLGPLGHGFDIGEKNIIVVGGGIGVPPMLCAAKSHGGATAVIGFRSKDRVILEDEFKASCKEIYITTDDGSYQRKGFVSQPLEELLQKGGCDGVLACGPKVMLRSVADVCEKYGVHCQVSMEERMGCGVGACLVCACKTTKDGAEHMSRVCKDGPVFDAKEVVW
jgi:dihydroorotate dehydrogenase electron transfer subunit